MNFWLYPLIIIEFLVLLFMIVKLFMQDKIADIKSTKYFIPTLIINLLVYLFAILQTGGLTIFETFVKTLEYGTKACFLSVETDVILPLFYTIQGFSLAFTLSFIISIFTFVYVFVALAGRYIGNFIKTFFINLSTKEKIIIIGYNNDALEFYNSVSKKPNVIFWCPKTSKEKSKEILSNKKLNVMFDKLTQKTFSKFNQSQTTFVSFLESDQDKLQLLEEFNKAQTEKYKLFISVEGDFENTFKNSFSAYNVNFFNKHSLIAQKFIMDNVITSLIDKSYIDTKTATISDKLQINVFMFGYGRTNKNLFNNLMIDNQFLTLIGDTPTIKKVNYNLFDKNEYMGDKNFSYNTNRYYSAKLDKSDYFGLPEKPFNLEFYSTDINSKKFYNILRTILKGQNKKHSFNMIITSIASDLENIDHTMRLKQTFEEMGQENNMFFTKIHDGAYLPILEKFENVKGFGEYGILNYDTIVCDKLNQFSIDSYFQTCLKNADILEEYESFNKIRSVKKQKQEVEKLKLTLWKNLNSVVKDYNKYRSINLRTKLNLIGLDTIGKEQITNKEFYAKYDTLNEIKEVNRQKIYSYPYPNTLQPRNVLAMQEYLHTVAFLVSNGFLPETKKEILNMPMSMPLLNTKTRTSLLLSSYEALDEIFEKRMSNFQKEKDANLHLDIKKDFYQIMDDVPLHKYTNYLIYKR